MNQTSAVFPFSRNWDMQAAFISKLVHLEHSSDIGLAYCGSLMRFSVAWSMVHQLLPDGRPVRYRCEEGDEIPSLPQDVLPEMRSITKAGNVTDHQSWESGAEQEEEQSPYSRAAMGFFLPQWVAFGDKDQLLVRTTEAAQAQIQSMQNYMNILNAATAIAPYMVADVVFQRKRTGMLGELVNQGRALGRYEIRTLINAIQRRVKANSLNRGLSLEISYFDDQELKMKLFLLEVIPVGRIMFTPAFIVRAVWQAYLRITQDTSLNSSTRKHLLSLLAELEDAFLK